ncbi:MAG TPA: Gfo/Idh/MocA family oxidoreductase [Verrucomicrobiota bacterium]|nr:Gfo/Idh/MocA family oxidoreductase [Verrucomicrobiota bacterium]
MAGTEQSEAVGGSAGAPGLLARRQFLTRTLGFAAGMSLPGLARRARGAEAPPFRAAIIGHTGRGNYGHGHELIFTGRPNITVVAVADPDEPGRRQAAARAGARRSYADYRQMLEREKPHLVVVAPRWTGEHHAMARAALSAGAHVYLEKPITQTLAEADDLLAAAARGGLRIVVAQQVRLAPNILFLKQCLADGLMGELLEMRAQGKQDHRAGGEDLVVLGVHLFDLLRFFAGDPLWCAARVRQGGREITPADAHPATEGIGPVAGDDLCAQFAFPQGVNATFTSRIQNRELAEPWGLELIGARGAVKILMDMVPRIYVRKGGSWTAQGQAGEWRVWEQDPTRGLSREQRSMAAANQRVVDDWLAAIAGRREPLCSGYAGMKALEMAMAVFAAGLARQRVAFPLANRNHPLRAPGS